jgi:hypothetical protein
VDSQTNSVSCDDREVSFETLERELSHGAIRSIRKALRKGAANTIPDYSALQVADVILTRPITSDFVSKNIDAHQAKCGFGKEQSCWCHAMLYIGDLHVAESTVAWWDGLKLRVYSGVRVVSILEALSNREFVVLRGKELANYPEIGSAIAKYALLDFALNRRNYNVGRIAEFTTNGFMHKIATKMNIGALKNSIICSEYVLECLAIGGAFLVEEYEALKERSYFYPANFIASSKFEILNLGTLTVIDGPKA